MAQNKFFLTREPASHQGAECFHFATHLNRTLTIDEGRELRDLLTSLLGDAPKAPTPSPDREKLKAFLMANFKNETRNETPEACAIRLLGKQIKK
jgi:hypothetical protein